MRSTSPPLTWTALVRALKSPVISRGDIAEEIETTQVRFHRLHTAPVTLCSELNAVFCSTYCSILSVSYAGPSQ